MQDNSFGYPFSDSAYVASNLDRIAIEKVLPSIFDSTSPDPAKKAKGEELLLGFFDGSHFNDSLKEIKTRIDQINSEPQSLEKIYVANYRTEATNDGSSEARDQHRRLAFLKVGRDCTSIVSLVPNDSDTQLRKSAIAVHVVCDAASLRRVDAQRRQGVWFYSWRKSADRPSHFIFDKQTDSNCIKCHSSRSSFAALDVSSSMPLDEHGKAFMAALYAKESRFMKSADFMMSLGESANEAQVAMPKQFALSGNLSFEVSKEEITKINKKANQQWSCIKAPQDISIFNDFVRCQSCHGISNKIAGPLFKADKGLILLNMARANHPFESYHQGFNLPINVAYECISDNLFRGDPLYTALQTASLETMCKNVKQRRDLQWLFDRK